VRFTGGLAAAAALAPLAARADDDPSPSPSPSASPATPGGAYVQREPGGRPHVHGPNGVTWLPEHRPVEWNLEVLDGPDIRLSALRGSVVIVNVFTTWCPPCRVEQPMLIRFAHAHDDDTRLIGVDVHEEDKVVRAYRASLAIPYPIAMHRNRYTIPGIFRPHEMTYPTTVVFRPDGMLSCAWKGDRGRRWFEAERAYALS
jgi:thiol-disulfide isomerase/thioredoxin